MPAAREVRAWNAEAYETGEKLEGRTLTESALRGYNNLFD
jgi:hypothetical protein